MAYTKRFEIKVNGTALLWEIDVDSGQILIKNTSGFELTTAQLENVETLLKHIIITCKTCPEIHSIEYSDIV